MLKNWKISNQGSMALPFAIALPAMVFLVGVGVDMSRAESLKSELQTIADNSAIFAAREFAVSGNDAGRIKQVALQYIENRVEVDGIAGAVDVNMNDYIVSVSVTAPPVTYFDTPLTNIKTLEASAAAQIAGDAGNVCLIALDETAASSIDMRNKSQLTAENCAIFANSDSTKSLKVNPSSDITVDQVYLVGGYQGNVNGLSAEPVTDSPPIEDPLQNREAPAVGMCDYNFFEYTQDSTGNLEPGVYCGGLSIQGKTVTADPGIYIIKDGMFSIDAGGGIEGIDTGFYLTGDDAKLFFDTDSTISLEAPRTGPMTGLLFFSDPYAAGAGTSKKGKKIKGGHIIRSDNARRLVGTIYLPDDKLIVDGETPVADESEYTVIIARAFELNNGPNLVIKTDYAASEVPVPEGLGPMQDPRAYLVE